MSAVFICDGCGKQEPASETSYREWSKPEKWYQRADKDGIQDACSRECVEKVATKSGKTGCVLPI